MAERISSFTNHGGSKYPWHEWTDGSIWRAKRGEDFTTSLESFRTVLSSKATLIGMRASAHKVDENTIEFIFTEPT